MAGPLVIWVDQANNPITWINNASLPVSWTHFGSYGTSSTSASAGTVPKIALRVFAVRF